MKRSKSDIIFDSINVIFMVIMLIVILYPLYFVLVASVSDPVAVRTGKTFLRPRGLTLSHYQYVWRERNVWTGFLNSVIYTVFGTLWSLFLTIPSAYVLSRKRLPGRRYINWYFLIVMFFDGGLIPTYLTIYNLQMINRPYTLIILGGMNIYNLIVARIFIESTIPEEIFEAARIDGASEFRTFFSIVLPLSKPVIGVIALYYGAARWNDYFMALVYINDIKYTPLQIILRQILTINLQMKTEGLRYAITVFASLPLFLIYPFVEKHFKKGVLIGSLKQ